MATKSVRDFTHRIRCGQGSNLLMPCTPHQHSPLLLKADKKPSRHCSFPSECSHDSIRPLPISDCEMRIADLRSPIRPQSEIRDPQLSKRHRLDHTDPVVCVQFTACEFRDLIKDLIRESADVEAVLALDGLHCAIRLHVDACETSVRIALLEHIPLSHRSCAAASAGINPRLVIRNKDHEIALSLTAVEQ